MLPHMKIPFLNHHWTDLPNEALQVQAGEVVVVVQVLQVAGVEWAEQF